MSIPPEPTRVRALVDQLARGDRSTALALHALISTADETGAASFDLAAKVYRDDYLGALRAEGRDAEREAGRLSLDEVRKHLGASVLPRLAADGVIALPSGEIGPDAIIRFLPRFWSEIAAAREEVATAFRQTGEHQGTPAGGGSGGYGGGDRRTGVGTARREAVVRRERLGG
ncbi:MAG: hypothetical protein ACHQWU_03130, partial [Gemmatimonadales bacterium]